ncbi:MAG: hypothetical protein H0Z39_11895 [Peptococcaceae bacterium]|nr:hypothetical protein [Peptococcaceae bacterium]
MLKEYGLADTLSYDPAANLTGKEISILKQPEENKVQKLPKWQRDHLKLEKILDIVCRQYGVTPGAVCGPSREQQTVLARQLFAYLASELVGYAKADIGRFVGRDDATIMRAVAKIKEKVKTGPKWRALVEELRDAMWPGES